MEKPVSQRKLQIQVEPEVINDLHPTEVRFLQDCLVWQTRLSNLFEGASLRVSRTDLVLSADFRVNNLRVGYVQFQRWVGAWTYNPETEMAAEISQRVMVFEENALETAFKPFMKAASALLQSQLRQRIAQVFCLDEEVWRSGKFDWHKVMLAAK